MDDGTSGGADTVGEAVAFARRFVALRYPEARAALLAGSRARGEAGPRSDYDVVLLFDSLPEGAWREKSVFEGRTFQFFGHDPGTLSYFCRVVAVQSAVPSVPEMVAEGIALRGEGGAPLAAARALAARTLAAGPPPFRGAMLRGRIYALTELVEILAEHPPGAAPIAIGGALYPMLADFALRTGGAWSATIKRMPAALAEMDPALADRFASAFAALFAAADPAQVVALADAILAPYGGRPRDSFRIASPPAWRD
jgi:hypothetical protein